MVTYSSTGPRKRFREMIAAHVGGHGWGLPGLAPIRNSCELRGLCCRSCFGPRTCGRGITNIPKRFGALNQGFPFSPLQCRQGRTRMDEGAAMCTMLCMQWLCCVLVVGKVWRIVPCVYKIYMLDRFQFHGLLRNSRDL